MNIFYIFILFLYASLILSKRIISLDRRSFPRGNPEIENELIRVANVNKYNTWKAENQFHCQMSIF